MRQNKRVTQNCKCRLLKFRKSYQTCGRPEPQHRGKARTVMKQVAELQPAFSAHLKLSGTDFDRWCKEMRVWSTASHFNSVENTVQAAFASKHTEVELEEKIRDKALREGVDLTFEAYVQLASAIFREQSSIFPRSVVWNSFNSVPRIPPQKDCCNTCQSSKWNSKQPKFPGYSTPQTLQPTRWSVKCHHQCAQKWSNVPTTQKGLTCGELNQQLERLHSLRLMEEALESKTKVPPKLNRVIGGDSTQRPEGGQGGGKTFGGNPNRRGLPAGLDVSKVARYFPRSQS